MKELSIEEKAKRYDEAIKKAREYDFSLTGVCAGDVIQDIFPELAESGDEKIRKWIYGIIKNICWSADEDVEKELEKMQPLALAWLEKQGEQEYNITGIGSKHAQGKLGEMIKNLKPTDKVEPKFKIGDWVVIDGEVLHIEEVTKDGYFTDEGGLIPFRNEKEAHIWTIQDAKTGNVLAIKAGGIFIYKELLYDKAFAYCGVDKFGVFKDCNYGDGLDWTPYLSDVTPATKEQRDLLFQKMKEAGYTWDAEKKKLEKIEQNHANVFNIYEKSLLEKFKQAVYDCAWGKVTCKEEGETQEEYAERWSEQFLLMVRDWADDYIDFTIQQKLRNSYKKGKTDAIEKLHEQKSAVWSKEDESMCIRCIGILARCYMGELPTKVEEELNWLKSLKDRYTWKPSDEQMKALADALNLAKNCGEEIAFDLRTLYEQLKKLN